MTSLSPTRVVSVMRPASSSSPTLSAAAAVSLYQQSVTAAGGIAPGLNVGGMSSVTCKEVQMAEVLRLVCYDSSPCVIAPVPLFAGD